MPISTDKNPNYGGNLVSQKYRPLENITLDKNGNKYYSDLLNNRLLLLQLADICPVTLRLFVPDWGNAIASENGKKPPLVIISSNRSKWIKNGIDAADLQLEVLKKNFFDNPSDLNALTARAEQKVSPPIYCPKRLGQNPNRNVYIVVHSYEYRTYKNNLANTGITVVGWHFQVHRSFKGLQLTGLGASRYAAIEFCKALRTLREGDAKNAGGDAPWSYAWLIDDNVVAIGPQFPGFAAVEEKMTAKHIGAGFQGGTLAEPSQKIREWAIREIENERNGQGKLPKSEPPAILQQAVLWNIADLTKKNLNFCPIYVASAEDISFVNYFDVSKIQYFYYGGLSVHKEETTNDDSPGSNKVKAARQNLAAWFAEYEAINSANPPPPIEVQPKEKKEDGGIQTLAKFVVERVLPKSLLKRQRANPVIQNIATCQGAEQITCQAINGKSGSFIDKKTLAAVFTIAANQIIEQRNR